MKKRHQTTTERSLWSAAWRGMLGVCAGAFGIAACSGEQPAPMQDGAMGGVSGDASNDSARGGDGGDNAGLGGANKDVLPEGVRFTYDPSKDRGASTCAAAAVQSTEIFLDMFVILDKSGSMTIGPDSEANDSKGYCDIGDAVDSRWCNSIHSLHGFWSEPTSVGTGVAFSEFSNGSCEAFAMEVPYARLEKGDTNDHLSRLRAELNDDDPAAGTNTEGAVHTLIAETTDHASTRHRETVAVLITDGIPSDNCYEGLETETDHLQRLNGLLVDHYVSTGVPTFIIGVDGVKADRLETLAADAGALPHTEYCIGADAECSYYSVGDGDPQVFIDALEAIRGEVLGCKYSVPRAEVGLEDLDTLQVVFTADSLSEAKTLSRVQSHEDCSSTNQYWVEFASDDDPVVTLCPAACQQRGLGAALDISLSCEGS